MKTVQYIEWTLCWLAPLLFPVSQLSAVLLTCSIDKHWLVAFGVVMLIFTCSARPLYHPFSRSFSDFLSALDCHSVIKGEKLGNISLLYQYHAMRIDVVTYFGYCNIITYGFEGCLTVKWWLFYYLTWPISLGLFIKNIFVILDVLYISSPTKVPSKYSQTKCQQWPASPLTPLKSHHFSEVAHLIWTEVSIEREVRQKVQKLCLQRCMF